MTRLHRLLHLGFAFPPGYQKLTPNLNPAGHLFEVRMIDALRQHMEVTTIGLLPIPAAIPIADADPASGLAHDLVLAECAPHVWHRWRSYRRLCQYFLELEAAGRAPETILFYNLRAVYSQFARWLSRRPCRPRLVLLLPDSSQLGYPPLNRLTRWRRKLKPFYVDESSFTSLFDACIGMSPEVKRYFPNRPFLWVPGACDLESESVVRGIFPPVSGPITYGFFGYLGTHSGAFALAKTFMRSTLDARLRVSGYGKQSPAFADLVRNDPRIEFVGLLPTHHDCLRFGASCDVLVNPRLKGHGNENNFPSKLFEYALCSRAILSSRLSGSDVVIGEDGFFYEPDEPNDGLRSGLIECANASRKDLLARGEKIRNHIVSQFTWPIQASRIASFIASLDRDNAVRAR